MECYPILSWFALALPLNGVIGCCMLTKQGLSIYMFPASKLSSKPTFWYSALWCCCGDFAHSIFSSTSWLCRGDWRWKGGFTSCSSRQSHPGSRFQPPASFVPWTLSEAQHQPALPGCVEGFFSSCFRKPNLLTIQLSSSYPALFTKKSNLCTNDLRGHLYYILNFQMYLSLFLGFQLYSIGLLVDSCVSPVLF